MTTAIDPARKDVAEAAGRPFLLDVPATVSTHLPEGYELLSDGVDRAPTEKGAYALVLLLGAPVQFAWRRTLVSIAAGWYVYAGNANGSGGIRGRLRHHLRPGKTAHWHIDNLTKAARETHAIVSVGGSECEIIARLSAISSIRTPLAGFGSSDCRICAAHLLRYDPAVSAEGL